ncbi:MAG: hypothetical protein Q9218_003993 [Villophora microphyllina]
MSTPTKSPITAFITNLRLLNLDQLDDWPNVNPGLFAVKHARENQKQRIGCVEWALYQLFALWNPKETKNKLQPFFPPYESLRSLNLRAALLRCLTELKKDGVLGKEIVIRKTMFDECRGDKFEELLAFFSTIVLQKVLRSRKGTNNTPAGRFATSRIVPQQQQKSLLPLAIAHQGSLKALLRRKALLKSRYANLKNTLDAKERELLGKVEKLDQADHDWEVEAVSDCAVQDIQQRFEANWHGNTRWAESILAGDREGFGDPLLDTPFSTVWTYTEKGTLDEYGKHGSQGLLQDLTLWVSAQQNRLRHWQQVQRSLVGSLPKSPTKLKSPVKAYGIDSPSRSRGIGSPLKFGNYGENGVRNNSTDAQVSPELKLRYRELFDLHHSPSKAKFGKSPMTSILSTRHVDTLPAGMNGIPAEAISDSNVTRVTPLGTALEGSTYCERHCEGAAESSGERPRVHTVFGDHTLLPAAPRSTTVRDPDAYQMNDERRAVLEQQISADKDSAASLRLDPLTAGRSSADTDEMLAQQIISSALTDEMSPVKRVTSLMERTRQSMAFSRTDCLLPDTVTDSRPLIPDTEEPPMLHRTSSLVERTRRSISLLPAPSNPKSIQNRRQSRYPTNQFETPRKHLEDLQELTPPDALFSPQADYASVFKSRPKVATSPNLSPTLARRLQWDQVAEDDEMEPG